MDENSKAIQDLSASGGYAPVFDNWNYSRNRGDSTDPDYSSHDKSLTNGEKSSFACNKSSTAANSSFNPGISGVGK